MTPGTFQPGNATPTSRRPVARMAASKSQNQLAAPSVSPAARRPTQETPGRGATRRRRPAERQPGLEGVAEGRIVGDDRLDHRVAISDRPRHPAAEMERNLKPHRRRVQRILVEEHELEPKAGTLDRRCASCRPGSDDEQLDALAWRQPLAVGGDRVEPSTQNIIPIPPLSSGVTGRREPAYRKTTASSIPNPKNRLGSGRAETRGYRYLDKYHAGLRNLSSSFSSFRRAVCTPSRGRGSAGRRYRWSANRRGSRRLRRRAR